MEMPTDEQWSRSYASCTTSALHRELRDGYSVPDEVERCEWAGNEVADDRAVVTLCRKAFRGFRKLGTPHAEYEPRVR